MRSACTEYRRLERAASSPLFPYLGLEILFEFTGEFDESRRKADILVNWVAVIVARNDFRTPLIGHGGGNFVEAGSQQIGNEGFDRLSGKQFGQGMQSRGIVQFQADGVFPGGSQRRRIFLPTIEQGLEFHDYSAIPDYKVCAL
jgi:hypothetical protein